MTRLLAACALAAVLAGGVAAEAAPPPTWALQFKHSNLERYTLIYKDGTALQYFQRMIQDKDLHDHEMKDQILATARGLDAIVKDPGVTPFGSLTGERMTRKAYSYIKGFELVE